MNTTPFLLLYQLLYLTKQLFCPTCPSIPTTTFAVQPHPQPQTTITFTTVSPVCSQATAHQGADCPWIPAPRNPFLSSDEEEEEKIELRAKTLQRHSTNSFLASAARTYARAIYAHHTSADTTTHPEPNPHPTADSNPHPNSPTLPSYTRTIHAFTLNQLNHMDNTCPYNCTNKNNLPTKPIQPSPTNPTSPLPPPSPSRRRALLTLESSSADLVA
jgi:hypothetical protein